ncbi:cytidine deaminase [Arthrobacter sp. PAMC 25486]|uniref:cytidine deaminase n=1 Tax=Arthrobacter sp. PAMC 25486 TaxID=1494608 RepID=UPI0005360149|nr:cytidine deaminase [Arthrobacter sp. PAMC 25486]AIY03507.1 cytidine deaminase [Arthrobacter sp. PAMC 25486]
MSKETPDGGWEPLRQAATVALTKAYAPYSNFPVGAAARLEDGSIVSGCNVENASYGLTLCAECTLVGAARMNGGGLITEFYCVDGSGAILMPCGRCRQLLFEFSTAATLVMTSSGAKTMDAILPDAFGPNNLQDANSPKYTENPKEQP